MQKEVALTHFLLHIYLLKISFFAFILLNYSLKTLTKWSKTNTGIGLVLKRRIKNAIF
jgi:hypothetical protein